MHYQQIDITELIKQKNFHIPASKKGHIGIDTETLQGNMQLIASSDDYILNRRGISTYEALEFISKYHNKYIWFFNLKFDYEVITKNALIHSNKYGQEAFRSGEYIIGADNRIYPVDNNFRDKTKNEYGRGKIKPLGKKQSDYFYINYSEGKRLSISHYKNGKSEHKKIICYDISNFLFYHNLSETAKKYLNKSKEQYGLSNSDIEITDIAKVSDDVLIRRCQLDAELTGELGAYLENLISEIAREHFNYSGSFNFTSKASLTETLMKYSIPQEHLRPFEFPRTDQIPYEMLIDIEYPIVQDLQNFAKNSYKGGLFQLLQKGKFSNLRHLDISSAYPNAMRLLPTLDRTEIIYKRCSDLTADNTVKQRLRAEQNKFDTQKCLYGFYRVLMQFDGYSPYRLKTGELIYPKTTGLFENYITALEVNFLRNRGYTVLILEGYEIYPADNYEKIYPFRDFVMTLYDLKRKYKTEDMGKYMIVKILLNSGYGKTAQSKYGIGHLTNFIYASYITAFTRIMITNTAEKYFKNVVEIATDSIIGYLNEEGERRFKKTNTALGQFAPEDEDKEADVIKIANGLSLKLKDTGEITAYKQRGFTIKSEDKQGNEMHGEITVSKNGKELNIKWHRVQHSKSAILQGNIEDIGNFLEETKRIKLNDNKRYWMREYSFEDLVNGNYSSMPFDDIMLKNLDDWKKEFLPIGFRKWLPNYELKPYSALLPKYMTNIPYNVKRIETPNLNGMLEKRKKGIYAEMNRKAYLKKTGQRAKLP